MASRHLPHAPAPMFVAQAKAARRAALRTGTGYDAGQVHAYVKRRTAAGKSPRPKARSWRD